MPSGVVPRRSTRGKRFSPFFGIFIFVATKVASQKLSLIEIWNAFLTQSLILEIFAKIVWEYLVDISSYIGRPASYPVL